VNGFPGDIWKRIQPQKAGAPIIPRNHGSNKLTQIHLRRRPLNWCLVSKSNWSKWTIL